MDLGGHIEDLGNDSIRATGYHAQSGPHPAPGASDSGNTQIRSSVPR